jgi:hypothetical protein
MQKEACICKELLHAVNNVCGCLQFAASAGCGTTCAVQPYHALSFVVDHDITAASWGGGGQQPQELSAEPNLLWKNCFAAE